MSCLTKSAGRCRLLRVAVAMVIFTLLVFTTVRTSPIYAGVGHGSSLSKQTPKHRHLLGKDFVVSQAVLIRLTTKTRCSDRAALPDLSQLPPSRLPGRYFNIPPPVATYQL